MSKKIVLKRKNVADGAPSIQIVDKQTAKFVREYLKSGIVEYKFKYESMK
ncbi:MAG: hypothetical protein QXD86_06440 [Candidatus Bathyarchaeia archaeon]